MANGTGNLTVQTVAVKLTDDGQERDHNEDCVGIQIPQSKGMLRTMGALYVVADGMGGHQAGEVASAKAREVVFREYYQPSSTTGSLSLDEELAARLKRAVRKANEAVYGMSQSSAQRKGMGTTTVAAVVHGSEIHIANVGDSRAYLLRNGKLRQITRDHSFVQEQIDAGILTPEMARNHPQKNVITRAMGHRPDVEVDTFEGQLQPGDKVLLCSDGLTGPVRDEQITAILQRYPIAEAATRLVDAANANGGPDNISVVLIEARPQQPGLPLAAEIPPASLGASPAHAGEVASPTAPGGAPPPPPPEPRPGAPARAGISPRFLAMGVAAALVLVAMIIGAVLLLGGGNGSATPDKTPLPGDPTFTPTVEEVGAGDPTSTPAVGGGEEEMAPTSTVAPGQPTSTPRPDSTATPTPEPTSEPACVGAAPNLVSPADESSHYSGAVIEFVWEGGNLCDGERWRVGVFGNGMERYCAAEPGQTRTSCQVNANPGEYNWRVDGIYSDGKVIPGAMSSARKINITEAPGGGDGGSSSTCPEKPTQPCRDRNQEWVCEDGEWVCK